MKLSNPFITPDMEPLEPYDIVVANLKLGLLAGCFLFSGFLGFTYWYDGRAHVQLAHIQESGIQLPSLELTALEVSDETKSCCLCNIPDLGEAEIHSYTTSALCEDLNKSNPKRGCKKLEVIGKGNVCSFFTFSLKGGNLVCTPRSIIHLEGEEKAPRILEVKTTSPCETGKIAENSQKVFEDYSAPIAQLIGDIHGASSDSNRQDTDKGQYPDYWTCGQSPLNKAQCTAAHYNNGNLVYQESGPLPEGNVCDREVCGNLFGESFTDRSNTYVHNDL